MYLWVIYGYIFKVNKSFYLNFNGLCTGSTGSIYLKVRHLQTGACSKHDYIIHKAIVLVKNPKVRS